MDTVIEKEVDALARVLWDYNHLGHTIRPADLIMCLGSHDTRVAERAAELYLQGYAPKVLFSGDRGRLTEGEWELPEADVFAEIAIGLGVPPEAILRENKSRDTGANIRLSHDVLVAEGLNPKSIILVQKPYMERRTYATFMKQWPGTAVEVIVTSPQISFEAYATDSVFREKFINALVGDTQRILVYAVKGFQIAQEMPEVVRDAYTKLAELGYDKHVTS